MRLYWEIARRGYRRYATYRAATLAGVLTNTIFGFMRAYVLVALFRARDDVAGFSAADALSYVFLTQGLLMVIYMWGWYEVALTIRSGDVVTDLSRPLNYQLYWLAQDIGRAVYHAIYRGVPPFLLAALVFRLSVPLNPATWLLFALSVLLAVCVSFALRFIVNLFAFWLLDYRGPATLMAGLWTVLSGFAIPLAFFPEPWRTIARALPFSCLIEIPVRVFLEKDRGLVLAGSLAFQAGWALALMALGALLTSAALRKVVVQGG